MPQLVTLKQMAERAGLTAEKLRRLVVADKVPYCRPGRAYLFDPEEVIAALKEIK